jgi:hypothetical protein
MNLKKQNRLLLLAIVSGYFFVAISAYFQSQSTKSICLFKNLTGYPCPGCGATRSTILLFKGHFIESILLNPVGLIINIMAISAIILIVRDLLLNKTDFNRLVTKKIHPFLLAVIVILVLINWVWNIVKGV